MRFTNPHWFFGLCVALGVAVALVWGALALLRALRRFGDREPVDNLLSHRVGKRRAVKGTLLVLAVAFGFVALAGPQYGKGTRLVPATNLDVALVIDYSKSMYARDVSPSRIERAKVEVGRLIKELAGARFGAVAFSGEPLSFPLTSDGGAIAQFFRQLSPNDMPVGGTAIGRALEAARALLKRDPSSERHQKVILLVTDGEDLEGDPVSVARSAAADKVTVHVVQIGGRTPEPIPYVNEDGTFGGPRTDSNGNVLTTQLTAEGENQLTEIAKVGGGFVVRSAQGETGLPEVTAALKKLMTEELSERVETVYADVFHYPLLLCLLLLLIDSFITEAPRSRSKRATAAALGKLALLLLLFGTISTGCQRLEEKLFTRYSPKVDDAISKLQAGDHDKATAVLQEYLATGACKDGQIGSSPALRNKPAASFDLGLGLFAIAEQFGKKFGEEGLATPKGAAQDPAQQQQLASRSQEVDCALQIVRLIASDSKQPATLRAQAYFLSGNLEFLRGQYQDAVTGYDSCLRLVPGDSRDAGLTLGDDAAYNRAIALRRIEEQKKQEPPDAGSPPKNPDGGSPNDSDQGQKDPQNKDEQGADDPQQQEQQKDQQKQDEQKDQQDQQQDQQQKDQQQDQAGQPQADQQSQQQQAAQQKDSPSLSQDERMLDLLEEAPTVQQQQGAAERDARRARGIRGMEDK
jgi:Ca-activated chloride channel family protein